MKIGDTLYRYIPTKGIWEFVVIEARESAYYTHYVVECQACMHGWKCKCLIGEDDRGRLIHIRLVDVDDEGRREQEIWHDDRRRAFHTTKDAANLEHGEVMIREQRERIAKAKKQVEREEKHLAEIESIVNPLREALERVEGV